MTSKALSDRALREKQRKTTEEQGIKEEQRIIEAERCEFIKETLDRAKKELKNYEQGYKSFSVKIPQNKYYSIDGATIDLITNAITKKYECNYMSLSLTKIIYPESYTLMFNKPKKDISKNL